MKVLCAAFITFFRLTIMFVYPISILSPMYANFYCFLLGGSISLIMDVLSCLRFSMFYLFIGVQ